MYQRLPDGPEPGGGSWDAVQDLDRFLNSFYTYYVEKGFRGIVASHLAHLVALAFTIGFSFVLLFFIDWAAILSCHSEETCKTVSLFYAQPFDNLGFWQLVVLAYFIIFTVYWCFNVVAAFHNVRDASEMSTYYKDKLRIYSDDVLRMMTWSEVVSRLIKQQEISPFCMVQDKLTALEIANIVMREDNFMVAFTNQNVLTSRLPKWIPGRLMYTKSVLWNVRGMMFYWLFDHRSRVRRDFVDRPWALAKRFQWAGLLNLVLVVPILLFVAIYFFMRHAEEFRSHRSSPFQRKWSDYARWTFREFNELPHQFHARMYAAQEQAEAYASSTYTSSPVLDSLRRCVKYVAGSIVAVLLVLALWDDTPLLNVKIHDKNLLWYLAFFGFLVAISEPGNNNQGSTESSNRQQNNIHSTPLQMHHAMMRLVECTHFLPSNWRAPVELQAFAREPDGHTRARLCQHFTAIRKELLTNFFCHRIQVLAEELLGVLLTPLLLGYYMPKAAPDIVEIVKNASYSSPNLGNWCSFGCLDLLGSGNEFYGGPPSAPLANNGSAKMGLRHLRRREGMISNGGKLEKSTLSFLLTHRLAASASSASSAGGGNQSDSSSTDPVGQAGSFAASGTESNNAASELMSYNNSEQPQQLLELQSAASFNSACAGVEQSVQEERQPQGAQQADEGADYSENCAELALTVSGPDARDVGLTRSHAGLSDSHDDLSSSQQSWSFQSMSQPGFRCGLDGSSHCIALQDFKGNDDPETGGNYSNEMHEAQKIVPVWGYPLGAVWFVHDLEEFQIHEIRDDCPDRDMYALMPEEFLQLSRVAPSASEALIGLRGCNGVWTMQDEMEKCVCGPHYFWIEMLYEIHSSRRMSQAAEANDPSSWSSACDHSFDIDHSWQAQRTQNSNAACTVQ